MSERSSLTRFAWLSIAAALATIALKTTAYLLTDSVGLLSDALESLVNLAGALMALAMLTIAARPADDEHLYGHTKAEYFSSALEGSLIIIAAGSIAVAAIRRLIAPRELEQVGIGLAVSVVASLINFGVSRVLMKAGTRSNSITLQANAHHLMTDVWTSGGVLVGVGAVALTGWQWLDPVLALAVAANIVVSGLKIIRDSIAGLMDSALPAAELEIIDQALQPFLKDGVEIHAMRTRQSGARRFVSFHVLVPGKWSVHRGHHLVEDMETSVREKLPKTAVFTHLEPIDDPLSFEDIPLDRDTTSSGDTPGAA